MKNLRYTIVGGVLLAAILTVGILMIPDQGSSQSTAVGFGNNPQNMMQNMGPLVGNMMGGMLDVQLAKLAEPQTAEKMAAYVRNFYDALRKKGFSKEEALNIVTSVSFPGMTK